MQPPAGEVDRERHEIVVRAHGVFVQVVLIVSGGEALDVEHDLRPIRGRAAPRDHGKPRSLCGAPLIEIAVVDVVRALVGAVGTPAPFSLELFDQRPDARKPRGRVGVLRLEMADHLRIALFLAQPVIRVRAAPAELLEGVRHRLGNGWRDGLRQLGRCHMDRSDDQGHAEAGGSAEHHACFSDIPAFALP